jgi:hypothetical protein
MRLATLVIVLYLTLDFSSPFVAGAFMFNADDSIEAATETFAGIRLVVSPSPPHGMITAPVEGVTQHVPAAVAMAVSERRHAAVARQRIQRPRSPDSPPAPDDHCSLSCFSRPRTIQAATVNHAQSPEEITVTTHCTTPRRFPRDLPILQCAREHLGSRNRQWLTESRP